MYFVHQKAGEEDFLLQEHEERLRVFIPSLLTSWDLKNNPVKDHQTMLKNINQEAEIVLQG